MNLTITRFSPPDCTEADAARRPATLARLTMFADFAAAEADWRALERVGALATPYQRYDFLLPWYRHLGASAGVMPSLIVGYDADGKAAMLCPFGVAQNGPLRVLSFLGGRHANFNMAIWRRDIVGVVGTVELDAILAQIAASDRGIDLVMLTNQPLEWNGFPNPFASWPQQPSPSSGYRGTLASDFEALMRQRLGHDTRKKLRKKMRVLTQHGPVRFARAATAEEARGVIDVFCAQKAVRMRKLGISNVFADAGTHAFIAELTTTPADGGQPLVEVYALWVGDTIVAIIGGMVGDKRFSAMFNSITSCDLAHESPGDHLVYNLMRVCCERGLTAFDLGVGDARYKRMFCDQTDPLFDSFLPLTSLGRLAAAGMRAAYDAKRIIKHTPMLWGMVRAFRHARSRISSRS